MTDITSCTGEQCPIRDKCYRYTAVRSCVQSYFMDVPYDYEKNSCEYYLMPWLSKEPNRVTRLQEESKVIL